MMRRPRRSPLFPSPTFFRSQNLADKLRRAASGLRPPWDSTQITLSAGIVEAVPKADYDSEDIVTDLINRAELDRKSTRLNSSHSQISYAVFCLTKKNHPPTS